TSALAQKAAAANRSETPLCASANPPGEPMQARFQQQLLSRPLRGPDAAAQSMSVVPYRRQSAQSRPTTHAVLQSFPIFQNDRRRPTEMMPRAPVLEQAHSDQGVSSFCPFRTPHPSERLPFKQKLASKFHW